MPGLVVRLDEAQRLLRGLDGLGLRVERVGVVLERAQRVGHLLERREHGLPVARRAPASRASIAALRW